MKHFRKTSVAMMLALCSVLAFAQSPAPPVPITPDGDSSPTPAVPAAVTPAVLPTPPSGGTIAISQVDGLQAALDGAGVDVGNWLLGVIRNSGSGFEMIDDAGHDPYGITSVSVDANGDIRIDHAVGATKVHALIAALDETLAQYGLFLGPSVGQDYSIIKVYASLDFIVNLQTGAVSSVSNFHDASDVAVTNPGTPEVTIIFPNTQNASGITAASIGSANPAPDLRYSLGNDRVIVSSVGSLAGYISFASGTTFNVTHDLDASSAPTTSWSAGTLTVTHPNVSRFGTYASAPLVTTRAGAYTAKIDAFGSTTTTIQWYDATGALVTTPDSDMRATFHRPNTYLKLTKNLTGSLQVNAGLAKIDCNRLIAATGNIWLIGNVK